MKRSIIVVPNPILRAKSVAVDLKKDLDLIKKYVKDLEETLEKKTNPKGVGLSAPQIGKNLRVFSTLFPPSANAKDGGRPMDEEKDQAELETYLNPTIVSASKDKTFGPDPEEPILEGCLSIPKLYGPVPRFSWVTLHFWTPKLEEKEAVFHGFFARVMQHEFDHLEGILFTDHIRDLQLPLYEQHGERMTEIDASVINALG